MTPLHETMHKGVGTIRYYPHAVRAPYFVFVRSYFAETGLRACFVDVWNMSSLSSSNTPTTPYFLPPVLSVRLLCATPEIGSRSLRFLNFALGYQHSRFAPASPTRRTL